MSRFKNACVLLKNERIEKTALGEHGQFSYTFKFGNRSIHYSIKINGAKRVLVREN